MALEYIITWKYDADSDQTYAKQLFSSNSGHSRILGLGWNKITDKTNIRILEFS